MYTTDFETSNGVTEIYLVSRELLANSFGHFLLNVGYVGLNAPIVLNYMKL